MLKIYNSLTKQKDVFQPLEPGKVKIYVCGITVYDYCHIGHGRMTVAFDVVVRFLRSQGYDVTYVRNITDVDDKIIQRALENDEDVNDLVERYIKAMHEDERALFVLPPDVEPRATAHMTQIIAMTQTLLDKDYAYVASNGDVYFDVEKFPDYGKLARRDLDGEQAGARVEVEVAKRNPLDFVLWKMAKENEPSWESPWGAGRPGWHIECSAMSTSCLGNTFDIHGGGFDLKFPHHENEIAQSEAATGKKFVSIWMHNGFVQVKQEKMSKSLGNFFTIREVLKTYSAEVIRYFIVSSHYRSQINYSQETLDNAKAALTRLYGAVRDVTPAKEFPQQTAYRDRFNQVMCDDFNTAEAVAVLFDMAHELNKLKLNDKEAAAQLAAELYDLAGILGLMQHSAEDFFQHSNDLDPEKRQWIEQFIQEREQARQDRDWAQADKIRDQLLANGVALEDKAGETVWRLVSSRNTPIGN